jgi:hypothetical protein
MTMISVRIEVQRSPDIEPMLMAGLAGGVAEVVRVALYSARTPLTAADVLRGIVASVLPALAERGLRARAGARDPSRVVDAAGPRLS